MARLLSGMSVLAVALILLSVSPNAAAICISPLLTPTECDFKDEDTHLWLNQAGWKLSEEKKYDTLIHTGEQALSNYYATLKTSGDEQMRAGLTAIRESLATTLAFSTLNDAVLFANDPLNLKALLDGTVCQRYWQSNWNERCPSAAELPVAFERQTRLQALIDEFNQVLNERTELGEQWGDIAAEMSQIRNSFSSAMTVGRNLDVPTKVRELHKRFPGYAQMMARPKQTLVQWRRERRKISATLDDTIRDTMMAAREMTTKPGLSAEGLPRQRDYDESQRLNAMNRDALGRMQVMEVGNMQKAQSAQAWLKITEQQINVGNLIGLTLLDELYTLSNGMSIDSVRLKLDPNNPTIVGNEAPLPVR